ncbi:hypothetical protein SHKM778_13300 [Streptomyces sp. KM77-8]|uniref:Uncharacterized protein n=1 Tax=Streptomyces haneummycinicus TaxID=3074435 RepID=A0AAT9HC15_9ACTN
MGFEATYADFSVEPSRLANADVRFHGARFAGSHVALSAGGSVALEFEVADPEDVPQVTLTVTALVSRLGSDLGYAPMSVLVQGRRWPRTSPCPVAATFPRTTSSRCPAVC